MSERGKALSDREHQHPGYSPEVFQAYDAVCCDLCGWSRHGTKHLRDYAYCDKCRLYLCNGCFAEGHIGYATRRLPA